MSERPSRRWFQLSLKSLFLLTLLVATFFAGYALRGKQDEAERRAVIERQQVELEALRARAEAELNETRRTSLLLEAIQRAEVERQAAQLASPRKSPVDP